MAHTYCRSALGGTEFVPMPLYRLKKKHWGFKNFLLAYGSGFDTITILAFISSTANKKAEKTSYYRKNTILMFSVFSPCNHTAISNCSGTEKRFTQICKFWMLVMVRYKNTLRCIYYLNICIHSPLKILLDSKDQKKIIRASTVCVRNLVCYEYTIHPY